MALHQPALAVAVTFPGPGRTDKQAVQTSWKRKKDADSFLQDKETGFSRSLLVKRTPTMDAS